MALTGIAINTNSYRPRNDHVIVRRVPRGIVRGVMLPDVARDSHDMFVVAIGPKVEDLKVGDQVICSGVMNVDIAFVPGETDLIITKEANVCIIVGEL